MLIYNELHFAIIIFKDLYLVIFLIKFFIILVIYELYHLIFLKFYIYYIYIIFSKKFINFNILYTWRTFRGCRWLFYGRFHCLTV